LPRVSAAGIIEVVGTSGFVTVARGGRSRGVRVARRACAIGICLLGVYACSFTNELDALADGECGETAKECREECVPLDSPATGCAKTSCAPCALSRAVARCALERLDEGPALGGCAVASCHAGWDNCNGNDEDGCEQDIDFDPKHCGRCDSACELAHAVPDCRAGACIVAACETGFADCDGRPENGCECRVATD
jgi:hypothetical protein